MLEKKREGGKGKKLYFIIKTLSVEFLTGITLFHNKLLYNPWN
jgi:hypothetical protein